MEKKKKIHIMKIIRGILLALIGGLIVALIIFFFMNRNELLFLWKMHESYSLIETHDIQELSSDDLSDAAVQGMIDSLGDPYAAYYDQEAYQEKKLKNQGKMVGIGATVIQSADNGYLTIDTVYENSPAEEAGLESGDVIIAADGTSFENLTSEEALDLTRGEAGTTVTLTIQRDEEQFDQTLKRAKVEVPCVSMKMIDDIAYIRITTFNKSTPSQFSDAVDEAIDDGATALIFDVRSNVGGLVNSAISMLDKLLPEGTLATKVEKNGKETVLGTSDASCIDLPMAVLTNSNTASSSELFTAALRDYDWATIVGTKTYGKGVMQTTYALSDSSAIKFTTAYFNPPCGENFNGIGIEPDIEITEEPDSGDFSDPDKDPVLKAAIETLKKE